MPALYLYLQDNALETFSLKMDWSYGNRVIRMMVCVGPYLRTAPPTLAHDLILPDFRQERVTGLTSIPTPEWFSAVYRAPHTTQRVPFVDDGEVPHEVGGAPFPSEHPISETFEALKLLNQLKKILRTS